MYNVFKVVNEQIICFPIFVDGIGWGRKQNKKSFRESPAFSFFKSKKFYYNWYSCWYANTKVIRKAIWTRDGNRSGWQAPVGSTGTGRVDRQVGLPVGSWFFDRPVKPVEKPVEFSFLATTRHLSTNRNIPIYFVINKTFNKKSVLTNRTFWKLLLNGFKLWLICCNHSDMYIQEHSRSQGGGQGARPPPIKIPLTTKNYDNIA